MTMTMPPRAIPPVLLLFCAALLAACGGGGGGGSVPAVSEIALSASSVSFRALVADANPDQKTLVVTWNDPKVAGVVVGTTPTQPSLPAWLAVTASGNTSPVTLTVERLASSPPLAPGNYSFPLRVVTGDVNQNVLGSADFTVNYQVIAVPTVAPAAVTANWVESESPASQQLTVAGDSAVQLVQSSVSVAWLSVAVSGNTLTLSGNAQSQTQPPGSATAAITTVFALDGRQSTVTTPVTAQIARALSGPAQLTFTVNASSTAASISGLQNTIASATHAPLQLQPQASVPWLTLSAATTGSANNLTMSLVPAQLQPLADGTYSGTVTVTSATPNITPLLIPVTLTMNLPEVQFVAPVAFTDTVGTDYVIVRGQGFSDPATGFQLAGQPLTSITPVSDTEFRFVPGALGAGTFPVSALNRLNFTRGSAGLKVITAPVHGNFSMATTVGPQSELIVSPVNDSLFSAMCYFCNTTATGAPNTVQRFAHDAATDQWTDTQYTYANLIDIALTPDEASLLVLTTTQLLFVDPATMATTQTVTLPQTAGLFARDLAVTNNGLVIIQSIGSAYSLHTGTFTSVPGIGDFVTTSRDGSRVLFGSTVTDGSQPFQYYDASSGAIVASATFDQMQPGSYSRHAERGYANLRILDANLMTIGTVAQPSYSGDLTPDGKTAFALDYPATNTVDLHQYDLSQSPFVEQPVRTLGTVNALGIGKIAVDPHGGTLFVVTEKLFQVIANP